ncbi:DUF6436 domain-containing protein [Pedobacter sp. GR22-6]|uniref:DUF6436 domain-containing protein n=1 Tax=Pedobacter sp. GR22-6 TaxID=3127957 RepID=UPI00307F75D2
MRGSIKKFLVLAWLLAIGCAISAIFWYQDYVYNLPTPVPKNYRAIPTGTPLQLSKILDTADHRPTMLHFFNPYCPCSKFNRKHLRQLYTKYGSLVRFIIVLPSSQARDRLKAEDLLGTSIPMISDPDIAKICGVYSTPQAVIIDPQHQLYYRGNYNTSRYCTKKETEFARLALEDLLQNKPSSMRNPLASIAYGCGLPPYQPLL